MGIVQAVGGRRNSCEEDEEGGRRSRDVDYVDYEKEQQRQGSQVGEYRYGAALGGRWSWKRERLEIKSPARSRIEVHIWGRFGGSWKGASKKNPLPDTLLL